MIRPESLTEEDKSKIIAKVLAQRDSARRRSKRAALDKRQSGMMRVTVWVPKEQAKQLHQEAARLCAEFARLKEEQPAGEVGQQHDHEHQPSLFEPRHIEWKLNGQSV